MYIILYEFKLGHDITEVAKNFRFMKDEGTIDHRPVIRLFNKFCLGLQKPK